MLFKNMKIGTKLMVFIFVMEALIIGVAYHGISVARETGDAYKSIFEDDVMATANAYEMGMHFQHSRTNMLLAMNATDSAQQQAFVSSMEKNLEDAAVNMKNMQACAKSEAAQAKMAELQSKFNSFRQESSAALQARLSEQQDAAAQAASSAKFAKLEQEIGAEIEEIADMGKTVALERDIASQEEVSSDIKAILGVAVVMILVSLLVGMSFARDIKKRLAQLGVSANKIAEGDLATEVITSTGDELGDVAASFEIMRQRMRDVLVEINHSADQVAAGAQNVSEASVSLSQGASEQAASVEELSASISEIASQTASNAQNAETANELTIGTRDKAQLGNQEMQEMLLAMEEINAASANISKIIKVIDEIAFQTNILALNAAVEAARAGQHGKGFAVVAEEVRNLAARSAKAAKETTDMIEGSMQKVEAGRGIAHKTAEALNAIVADVSSVADIVASIAKASNEQKLALEQINQGVQQVSQVVQANSSTSEEAATASQNLTTQAEDMKNNVHKFQLGHISKNFTFAGGNNSFEGVQRPSINDTITVKPAKPGVKPKTIALTDEEGFGKY